MVLVVYIVCGGEDTNKNAKEKRRKMHKIIAVWAHRNNFLKDKAFFSAFFWLFTFFFVPSQQ